MKSPFLSALALSVALTSVAGHVSMAQGEEPESPSGEASTQELKDRLARAELLAGLTAVEGPGVIVRLRNSPRAVPKGLDRKALQVGEQDFNAILSCLRAAGAEALAIGGQNQPQLERVLAGTAAQERFSGLSVNGVTLQPPYRIMAIGNAASLRAELMREGGVVKRAGLDVLQMIEVETAINVVLPPARETPGSFKFARQSTGEIPAPTVDPEPMVAVSPDPPAPTVQPAATVQPAPAAAPRTAFTDPGATGKIAAVVRRPVGGAPPVVKPPVRQAFTPPVQPREDDIPEPTVNPEPPVLTQPRPRPVETPKPVETVKPAPVVKPVEAPRPVEIVKPVETVKPAPAVEKPKPVTEKPKVLAAGGAVFGGRGLAKYHQAGCRYGERIEPGQRVTFSSAQDAADKGRTPCPICHGGG